MLSGIIFCVLLIIAAVYGWQRFISSKKAREKFLALLPAIHNAVQQYGQLTNFNTYFSNRREQKFLEAHATTYQSIPPFYAKTADNPVVAQFIHIYKNLTKERIFREA